MKNLNRLYDFYKELQTIHIEYFSDWRYGQLCSNFSAWLSSEKKIDLFFPEEEEMLKYIREYAEKYGYNEMKDIRDVSDMVCGNDYKICYKDEKFNQERWVYGEVVNYNNSGVFLICDDKFVIIPHRAVIWMLPYGSTTQKKSR